MALPWLLLLDTAIGMTDLARRVTRRPRPAGAAALKEAFDRDTRRLELERDQLEKERRRAELALRVELLRQAGDREIGRLRLLSIVAVTSWLGVLFFSTRLVEGQAMARAVYGIGWVLLLAALGAASVAQQRVARALARIGNADPGLGGPEGAAPLLDRLPSGLAGTLAPWLIVAGLAVIAVSVLIG
jgi:hypothetical protein